MIVNQVILVTSIDLQSILRNLITGLVLYNILCSILYDMLHM